MTRIFIFISIVFLVFQANSQDIPQLNFTRFDSRNKLPSDEFNMIYQDQNDVMWFGNNTGLLQFDGYDFITPSWLLDSPYSNIQFNDMIADSEGNFYMGTQNGLLFYSPTSGKLKMILPSEYLKNVNENNNISVVAYDTSGKIWFGTASGVYCYWMNQDSISSYPIVDGSWKGRANVLSIEVSKKNEVWIGIWGRGMARFNEQKKQFDCVYYNQRSIAENVRVIKEDKDGLLWVGSWKNGLIILDVSNPVKPKLIRQFTHIQKDQNSIAGDIILDLDFDQQNRAWIGSPYGLSILTSKLSEPAHFVNYQQNAEQSTIANNEISAVMRDRSGVIWLATGGGGINKVAIQSKEIEYFNIPNVDPLVKSQSVYSFTIDHKNRLLVGVKGLGFGVFDLKTKKYSLYNTIPEYKNLEKIILNTARCFAWDNDSNLWIGARYKGIIKLNPRTGEYINLSDFEEDIRFPVREVFSMRFDKNGRLWVATNNGLFRISAGNSGKFNDLKIKGYWHKNTDPGTLAENALSDVLIDDDGFAWVSTFNSGINKSRKSVFDSDQINFDLLDLAQEPESGLGTDKIMCLFKDRSGKIWIGTVGKGLKFWDPAKKKFEQAVSYNSKDGMIVYSITEDQGNNLWITTNKGISRIRANNDQYEIDQFSFDDGLQGNVFIKGAAFLDSKSNLYVGGHNGFNRLNLDQIRIDDFVPKVLITSVKVDDHQVNVSLNTQSLPLVLKHTDKYLTVSFSSLDFFNPDQNKYAYMLEGFDRTWQYTNSNARSATFGNLSPGNYKFMLKGTNSRGKWNEEPAVFFIEVKTAPYKTWWAILAYVLFVGGLIYLYMSLRIKNIQIQKSLELENIKRTKQENITQFKLQFFTNISHELLTPLSILKILSERINESAGQKLTDYNAILERNVSRLHALINQILQFRKAETGNMKINVQELDVVPVIKSIYSNYNLLAEKKNIVFQLEQPNELIGWLDIEKIEIVLNNLISNAFKYSPDNGTIDLKVFETKDAELSWVNISVTDTGIGISKEDLANIFDRFYRIGKISVNQSGIGIGLALTKNLVTLHGGSILVESEPGKGTCFMIRIPISSGYYQKEIVQQLDPMIDSEKIIAGETTTVLLSETLPAEKMDKVLLLVENEEDYRMLLKEKLESYIRVIACSNGQEALEVAKDTQIDIVVSDLNMPVMNGNDFCRAIKSDINTSHIPFILITAFPDEKERYESYESGADSFLNKPLNISILVARMKSLLKKREEIQQKFTMGAFLEPKNIATSSLDEKIIEKAKSVIEANISNPDFSVKTLCDELGMTNSTLYRKMKGILNMMPNEFIRNIRLRRAAQLLEDPAFDIAEAAYSIGFNDPSYFSACFKKQYGVTPSAYQKGKRSKEDSNE